MNDLAIIGFILIWDIALIGLVFMLKPTYNNKKKHEGNKRK